jgi:uncharacterized membrane protein YgcG
MLRFRISRGLKRILLGAVLLGVPGCALPGLPHVQVYWTKWYIPWLHNTSIPDQYPIGSVVRSHFHTMQTNAEASDFILLQCEFVGDTAELTPAGRDHILEIGARMRSAPFPVIVERSENNANPQLDFERRQMVAAILADLGNSDADQRTFVSPTYGRGITAYEGEIDYYRFIYSRGGNNGFGGNAGVGGFGGGFGGGGAGGGFF